MAANQQGYLPTFEFAFARSDGVEHPSLPYEALPQDHVKYAEMGNKIAMIIGNELLPAKRGQQAYTMKFPANYTIRKYEGMTNGKKVTHYYIFGYPELTSTNKPRLFRSPNEFIPHLMWLLSDSTEPKNDCTCHHCRPAPESKQGGKKPVSVPAEDPAPSSTSTAAKGSGATTGILGKKKPSAALASNQAAKKPATQSKQAVTTGASISSVPVTAADPSVRPSATPTVRPSAGPSVGPSVTQSAGPSVAQSSGPSSIFRKGEVVWFQNSTTWRIGIICAIGSADGKTACAIVPFQHPAYRIERVTKAEADLRPFLAFSVPMVNHYVEHLKGKWIAEVDWTTLQQQLANGDSKKMDVLALEASKLAALLIDHSFSTFSPVAAAPNQPIYRGVFLGAEKIVVGEPIRVRHEGQPENSPVVMVVLNIWIDQENALVFSGRVWRIEHASNGSSVQQQQRQQIQHQLPQAMLREKAYRDRCLGRFSMSANWVPVGNDAVAKKAPAVRGRFYETEQLADILKPPGFQQELQQGRVRELQAMLNNCGDSNLEVSKGRVANRAAAVAGAIPEEFVDSLE
ncbi:Uu.00g023080.m01.CDS01 [Anthostomella pinea]|uniref:Uu.00g023080.m01.CDS01 n=1 Tax=Anthostomella pinea TaxID=933095 RepID=A0AAI8W0M2_9PEZI|nr:Uu.00g023080.m01.CDS01 [Anthostomella pinea]